MRKLQISLVCGANTMSGDRCQSGSENNRIKPAAITKNTTALERNSHVAAQGPEKPAGADALSLVSACVRLSI